MKNALQLLVAAKAEWEKHETTGANVYVLFLDQDREINMVEYTTIEESTLEELQDAINEGHRPVCIEVVPWQEAQHIFFDNPPSIEDQIIVDAMYVDDTKGLPGEG